MSRVANWSVKTEEIADVTRSGMEKTGSLVIPAAD